MDKAIDNYFSLLKETIDKLDKNSIQEFVEELKEARKKGKNIFIMGNGGSAATASHFACDFNKGLNKENSDTRFRIIPLSDNLTTILAYSNDFHYDEAFKEQLKNFLKKEDIVIGISGSGNSKSILNAIEYAKRLGSKTIGFTGYDGGKLKNMVDISIHAPVCNMQIAEDIHMSIFHMLYNIFDLMEE